MGAVNEESIREEAAFIMGRELSDKTWAAAYEQAKRKLRHIVAHFGDADGARNTVEYIAQLVVEAVQAEAMAQYCRVMYDAKSKGAGTNADPQGHTHIIPQAGAKSQAPFGVTA